MEGDTFEGAVYCKMCGWASRLISRGKAIKGECPYCGTEKSLEPL